MKTVITIILVMLALVAVVLFVLVGQDNTQMEQPGDPLPVDTNTDLTPPEEIIIPEEVIPVDPTIDCGTDFSCFSGYIPSCQADVKYLQEDEIEYVSNGTKYNFSLQYNINGLNEFDECLVGLTLVDHKISFLESERQKYLSDSYTEEGVLEMETLINGPSTHLISKTGVCKLDVSSHNPAITSLDFLNSIMQGYENCSGDLFTTNDPSQSQFFIYIN